MALGHIKGWRVTSVKEAIYALKTVELQAKWTEAKQRLIENSQTALPEIEKVLKEPPTDPKKRAAVPRINVASVVDTLSGGNQQKVVFGKWLETKPELLILDEPTRGLDIAAKGDILRLSAKLAGSGVAILLISSELEELMNVCHRYVIVSERRIVAALPGNTDEATLVAALSPTGAGAAA